jgi:hypothetical protein
VVVVVADDDARGCSRVAPSGVRKPRPVAAARDASDEVRALGNLCVQLAGDAVRLEITA